MHLISPVHSLTSGQNIALPHLYLITRTVGLGFHSEGYCRPKDLTMSTITYLVQQFCSVTFMQDLVSLSSWDANSITLALLLVVAERGGLRQESVGQITGAKRECPLFTAALPTRVWAISKRYRTPFYTKDSVSVCAGWTRMLVHVIWICFNLQYLLTVWLPWILSLLSWKPTKMWMGVFDVFRPIQIFPVHCNWLSLLQ